MTDTAKIAAPIAGNKPYQERARSALPLLVRQAEAKKPILYSDLALELGMPNPRNLNYPLGSIGKTLELLSEAWGEDVPPIQCLVINKNTGLPGEGIAWFLHKGSVSGIFPDDFGKLPKKKQREIVEAELQKVFYYPRWREVLAALSLEPATYDHADLLNEAVKYRGGESEAHKQLKEFVAKNPGLVGLSSATPKGETELKLLSGDVLDVSFAKNGHWLAAEVKSQISGEQDILRGLFQCVKYRAVMEATLIAEGAHPSVEAVLVLEGTLPPTLTALKNMFGVTVFEGVGSQGA